MLSETLAVVLVTIMVLSAAFPSPIAPVPNLPYENSNISLEYPSLEVALAALNITNPNTAVSSSHIGKRDFFGRGAVYLQENTAGSCGITSSDGDSVVALGNGWMHSQGNAPLCGHRIWTWNDATKKLGIYTIRDTCVGCGDQDVDFSVGGWNWLMNGVAWGRFNVKWWLRERLTEGGMTGDFISKGVRALGGVSGDSNETVWARRRCFGLRC